MKNRIPIISFFLIFIFFSFGEPISAQTTKREIPSKLITGKNMPKFVDSLKQKILSDTIKFNQKDLRHINGKTENLNSYSMLFSVDMKYFYRLDIISNKEVKAFVNEILKSENIITINLINEEKAIGILGSMAKNG